MSITDAKGVKQRLAELETDIAGIASIDRFHDAPPGFHPTDLVKDCQSVIVFAVRFPTGTLYGSSQAAYTFVRNRLADKIDSVAFQLARELEEDGKWAVPIPSTEPYEYWDEERQHGRGILSLKHAAVLAGLGQIGKNTLLVNERFGNMLWLGAVLVDTAYEADPVATYQTCPPDCRICLKACPAQALDGVTIEQSKCRNASGKYSPGGGAVYACNLCRKICPKHCGIG